ncbi:MAG: glycoside hydrolase, partial [Krumholzibacteria bacterium]|nr:glycoside hydrolase [Candidatus Krumholzibacteria bacterium]
MARAPFTLLLIHHSHTDIGYTDLQGRILRRHVHFLRRAMDICGRRPEFRWQCETFWPVERALTGFSREERGTFARLVAAGRIGLSANPLNFSELADEDLLQTLLDRHAGTAASLGTVLRSAMTADINGLGRGWARAMLDHGVEHVFTCVHTHHGTHPLHRTQTPFRWEMPDGRRLLVWNGEHYHLGNEMGLAPDACASYLTKDECDADTIHRGWWQVAETRIRRYCAALKERGYLYRFAPLMISGLRTDNGPPSEAILDAVERWNAAHGGEVTVAMTTLDAFFDRLHAERAAIPVHAGDWPDWWSDGPTGDAPAVRLFRCAVRDLARLTLGHWEYRDRGLDRGLTVRDASGDTLPCQFDPVP